MTNERPLDSCECNDQRETDNPLIRNAADDYCSQNRADPGKETANYFPVSHHPPFPRLIHLPMKMPVEIGEPANG